VQFDEEQDEQPDPPEGLELTEPPDSEEAYFPLLKDDIIFRVFLDLHLGQTGVPFSFIPIVSTSNSSWHFPH
jgi:hypothetical protein